MIQFSRLVRAGYDFVPAHELADIEREKYRLTAVSRFDKDVRVPLYKESGLWFGFPRYHKRAIASQAETIDDLRTEGSIIDFKLRNPLRVSQVEVVQALSDLIDRGGTGFMLRADPGWGKTRCCLEFIRRLYRTALVVVPSSVLVDQWVEVLQEQTTLREDQIGIISGRQVRWKDCSVVVALVHTLATPKLAENKEFRTNFGQVWFDEVHSSLPPATFASVVGNFAAKYRGALSATPDRSDGLDSCFRLHVAEHWFHGKDEGRMIPTAIMLRYRRSSGELPGGYDAKAQRGMLLSKLAHNPDRNNLLVRLVGLCRKKGRKTALISERTEQLASVQALASNVLPGDKVGYFCRSLTRSVWQNRKRSRETTRTFTAAELDVAKKNSDVLLATYGMLRQGTDIPDLSALIYGTPQSDPRQSKGRTERYVEGKLPPVVVCIVDTYYPKCITWAEEQERHFLRSGMRVYWKEAADVIR